MDRFPLRSLRLRPGDEVHETIGVPIDPFLLGGQEYLPSATQVDAQLTVQRAVSGDVFRLVFSATFVGPCMRCLADAMADVEIDSREYHASDADASDELRTDYVVEGDLLIRDWVRDQAAVALPAQILCRPECLGLCPECGLDLNVEPHEHGDTKVDPRWAALLDLQVADTDEAV